MRCPSCAARNADGAAWCTQCYAVLDPAAPPEETPERPPASEAVEREETPSTPDPLGDVPSPGAAQGRRAGTDGTRPATGPRAPVRAGEAGLEWRCATCETWNDMDVEECEACGANFSALLADDQQATVPRDPQVVLAASLVLPGSGHVMLGRVADGVVRGGLFIACVAGAAAILGAGGSLPAVPLVLGALVIWALTAADVVSLSRGGRTQLMAPRVLLWLVVAVVGGLILALLPALTRVGDLGP